MSERPANTGPRFGDRLRSVVLGLVGDAGTDGELLGRFVKTRDDAAFAELVRRLGPMVRAVCRGVLGDGPDLDDAFQATFVVLARKAHKVSPPGRVAAWVFGVATLAARKARHARRRRAWRETALAAVDPPVRPASVEPDLGPALADEIGKLPEKYRLPVVLCLVREMTAARAAAELGWPVGTVNTRLTRGRAMLGDRLIRRGLGVAAVTAGAVTADAAGVPTDLWLETARLATDAAAGIPPPVLSLSSEVIAAMSLTKLRFAVAGGLVALAVAVPGVGRFTIPASTAAAPPPTSASAPKDPLDRFKLNRLTVLLRPEGIQQDLGLTDDQKTKIEEARKKYTEDQQATLRSGIGGGGVRPAPVAAAGGGGGGGGVMVAGVAAGPAIAEMSKAMAEHMAACDKSMLAALSEVQVHRLKQIFLQSQGTAGLLDRRVIRALELSADQEDEIDKVLLSAATGRAVTENRTKDWEDTLANAVKVLTPAQKEKWAALVGKAVTTTDLILAAGPSGGSFSVAGGGVMAAPAAPLPPKK